ncbi:hypothetical protein DCAR_0935619 [Daucus carota subsp. sativus]|uniref:Uncharacterized protein n=1 Tax=Daucus carota subsp. sativus TaxID=79200 RepID=A0A175YI51_DAUCS|nr:hypothetical protein DCAR_0935619 [Daucus carota subsp. sativus]
MAFATRLYIKSTIPRYNIRACKLNMNGLNASAAIAIPASSQPSNNQTFPNNIQPNRFHALRRRIDLEVMNPYSRCGRIWRKFIISFFISVFLLQTLSIFLQYVKQDKNCIAQIDSRLEGISQILLKLSNIIFILHIIIKFRTAYVDPKSRLLVYEPKKQISTLAGNQTPSVFVVEVLFTMFITAMGLLLFSFLIGNIQRFLQARGSRSFENSLRGSDIEQWMSHRQLPDDLKAKIRESERYNWLATRGLNELMLLENLPEDLQRDIRRHLFKFENKLPIVASMDESILDAIRERMKHNTYIEGSRVLVRGGLMDKMVYIVQGKLESTSEGETVVPLSEGDVCGAELITLCLEHYVLNRDGDKFRIPAGKLVSKRTVRCLTNVEAFTLRAADLEDVFSLYSGLLIQNPLVQGAITKESLHPKSLLRSRSY